jgi:hypothetical protein
MQHEIDAARAEIGRSTGDLRQRRLEMLRTPVVDVAGDADEADTVRREAVELVRHDLHHGWADIADALAGAEHALSPAE